MITWLKKYWLKALISLVAIILTSYLSSLATKIVYKKQIKELDTNISEMWQKIGDSKIREESWKKSAREHYALAMEKEAKLRKKDVEMRVKIAEKRELKKKIKAMPPSAVIIRTVEIIQCDEIQQQEQGIVFSLNCGMENLAFLEDFSFVRQEADDWMNQYFTSQGEVTDLKSVIISKDGIIVERGTQLSDKDGIIADWTGKFNLSEKRGKSNWWKGLRTGGIVGGIVGLLAGFVLGK